MWWKQWYYHDQQKEVLCAVNWNLKFFEDQGHFYCLAVSSAVTYLLFEEDKQTEDYINKKVLVKPNKWFLSQFGSISSFAPEVGHEFVLKEDLNLLSAVPHPVVHMEPHLKAGLVREKLMFFKQTYLRPDGIRLNRKLELKQ